MPSILQIDAPAVDCQSELPRSAKCAAWEYVRYDPGFTDENRAANQQIAHPDTWLHRFRVSGSVADLCRIEHHNVGVGTFL